MDINIIKDALNNYDYNYDKNCEIIDKAYFYKIISPLGELNKPIIIFKNKNKQTILEKKFQIMGMFNYSNNSFAWSWFVYNRINFIQQMMRLLFRAIHIHFSTTQSFVKKKIRELFLTGITDKITSVKVDISLALAAFHMKNPLIIPFFYSYSIDIINEKNIYKKINKNMSSKNKIIHFLIIF